jgi:hypothetical protein
MAIWFGRSISFSHVIVIALALHQELAISVARGASDWVAQCQLPAQHFLHAEHVHRLQTVADENHVVVELAQQCRTGAVH